MTLSVSQKIRRTEAHLKEQRLTNPAKSDLDHKSQPVSLTLESRRKNSSTHQFALAAMCVKVMKTYASNQPEMVGWVWNHPCYRGVVMVS